MAVRTMGFESTNGFVDRAVRSFLDLFVLDLLSQHGRHGYEIMQSLEERTGTHVSPGTLYPLLYILEEQGLVSGHWLDAVRRDRRIYDITVKGTGYRAEILRSVGRLLPASNFQSGIETVQPLVD